MPTIALPARSRCDQLSQTTQAVSSPEEPPLYSISGLGRLFGFVELACTHVHCVQVWAAAANNLDFSLGRGASASASVNFQGILEGSFLGSSLTFFNLELGASARKCMGQLPGFSPAASLMFPCALLVQHSG
jgi:hypothetical protein